MSNHPFLVFHSHPEYGSRTYTLVGQTILHGLRIDMDVVRLLGFTNEVEQILSILPYYRVFTIDELCFEELITEYYASFEFHGTNMMLGGAMNRLMM